MSSNSSYYWVSVPYHSNQLTILPLNCYSDKTDNSLFENSKNIHLSCNENKNSYIQKVNEILKHIQQGDIYEINFCINFFAENININPFNIFQKVKKTNHSKYCELLKCGNLWMICSSPETFLERKGNKLKTFPMKGTMKRSNNKEEDQILKDLLKNDAKMQQENVMAVDVARNDLSKIAKRESVNVDELFGVYSFPGVHQMVSTISCEINPEITFEQILEATFPMASMTGAPKIKAMELIEKFESFERKFYSGCAGKIYENGDFESFVLIRSIFWNEETKLLQIPVGGAITASSDPEKEWEECLLKINKILDVLEMKLDDSIL